MTFTFLKKEEDRVVFVNSGHENIDFYIKDEVSAVIFNLGYLPKGDHNLQLEAYINYKFNM